MVHAILGSCQKIWSRANSTGSPILLRGDVGIANHFILYRLYMGGGTLSIDRDRATP